MNKIYTEKDRQDFEVLSKELAPWLIGKVLCHKHEGFVIRGRIRETEAYRMCDEAADGNRGTGGKAQLLSGGHLHYHGGRGARLDIVAGPEGMVESVLIRAIDPYFSASGEGQPTNSVLAMVFDEVPDLDGYDLLAGGDIWLEDDGAIVELGEPMPRVRVPGEDAHTEERLRFWAKSITFKCK